MSGLVRRSKISFPPQTGDSEYTAPSTNSPRSARFSTLLWWLASRGSLWYRLLYHSDHRFSHGSRLIVNWASEVFHPMSHVTLNCPLKQSQNNAIFEKFLCRNKYWLWTLKSVYKCLSHNIFQFHAWPATQRRLENIGCLSASKIGNGLPISV